MKSFKITRVAILFFIIWTPFQLFSQDKKTQIVPSLNNLIRPIETLKADSSFADLAFLKETLKEKELISLGEVTHGTAEVFQYKDRLVRFLVTNMGYKAIAFESDYLAVEDIDQYINGKTDSLFSLPGSALIGTNRQMLVWLRKYNEGQPQADKVHVYGLEARNFSNVISKILTVIPALEASDKILLERIKGAAYQNIKKEDLKAMKVTLNNLEKVNGNASVKLYVTLLQQLVDRYYETKIGARDVDMATNAIFLKEGAKDQRLILWAHNGHIAKDELYGVPAMGTLLDKKYGDKYFAIGTDFNHGKAYVNVFVAKNKPMLGFQAHYFPEVDSDKGYEFYFKQCKFSNFIIELPTALKDPVLNEFFIQPLQMRMIGSWSSPVNKKLSMAKNFDMVVFFNKTSSQWN
ncbi:erythromycin esterase family protein [Pedobacter gandavensis]|uniref:erythromycin esterase family protein n=1 Tax=Pedobacter gandavensis TaxID=2679963 RepID=UPI00292EE272|nr:erythromycin esterase family protein [Pedobacter gandavensis]